MEQIVTNIRAGLHDQVFPNEASISQGIVLRLLAELGWDIYNPSVVWPEYALAGYRVDFALCQPARKPVVLIEVKQPGHAINAERQLFEYAFHQGAPLVILTTGQEWQFFLPAEQGSYGERRVYLLDLIERSPEECVSRLRRYLDFNAVASGAALASARSDYRSVATEREVGRTLPVAWRTLIEERDELLMELLADKVENLCGYRPVRQVVEKFLSTAMDSTPSSIQPHPIARRVAKQLDHVVPAGHSSDDLPEVVPVRKSDNRIGFEIKGKFVSARNGSDLMALFFQHLIESDPEFPQNFLSLGRPNGKRPHLAPSRAAVHPFHPGLVEKQSNARQVPGTHWWVDVNLSTPTKLQVLATACRAAGLTLGTDVKVFLD